MLAESIDRPTPECRRIYCRDEKQLKRMEEWAVSLGLIVDWFFKARVLMAWKRD